ncbi:MAG: hypothetical protein G8345_18990 [Magnetococcales bacterium]|nr:hypothetical protein [Magnetococcales bacterium]
MNQPVHTAHFAVRLPGVPLEQVGSFLVSVEHFLRLNPYLEIKAWEQISHPRVFIWRLQDYNEFNGILADRTLWIRPLDTGNGYRLEYREGFKESTLVHWWQDQEGVTVVELQESYRNAANKDVEASMQQVDGSLPAWANSLANHFLSLQKWGFIPLFRWYRHKWLTLTPSQRRVLHWALWAIPLELVVVLVVLMAWLL